MIDTKRKTHESGALMEMLENHCPHGKEIVTADRGYETYELLAYMMEHYIKFAIRIKDIESNGILSGLDLPDKEFDITIKRTFTRKQTKEIKENRKKYVFMPANVQFRYLDYEHEYYEMKLRVVRFKITEDTYECLITNLGKKKFPPERLKELYHLRWNEEGSFRKLKYTVGTIYFHSRKQESIRQEIYAGLILYNFTQALINEVPIGDSEGTKYSYVAEFTAAVTNARKYFNQLITSGHLVESIKKFLVPVRPGRSYQRNIRAQSTKMFLYRAA